MITRAPDTLVVCYEPSPSDAILFGYIAEFIIDEILLNQKISDIKEGWAVRQELPPDPEFRYMRCSFTIGKYLIKDEALQRDLDKIVNPPVLSDE